MKILKLFKIKAPWSPPDYIGCFPDNMKLQSGLTPTQAFSITSNHVYTNYHGNVQVQFGCYQTIEICKQTCKLFGYPLAALNWG